MQDKKGVSKGIKFWAFTIVIFVIGIIGWAFYDHYSQPADVEEITLDGGRISLTYADDANLFAIFNATPTSDLVGTKFDSADLFFDFTIKTEILDANFVEYEIILIKDEKNSTALEGNVKVYLEKEDSGTYSSVFDPEIFIANVDDDDNIAGSAMSIYKNKRKSSGNDNYRLRMWISDAAVYSSDVIQNFGVKIAIKGKAK